MLIYLISEGSVRLRRALRRVLPTHILIDFTRTPTARMGVVSGLLAPLYLLSAATFARLVDERAPGVLNLVVLLCVWNAVKFGVHALICCIALAIGFTRSA